MLRLIAKSFSRSSQSNRAYAASKAKTDYNYFDQTIKSGWSQWYKHSKYLSWLGRHVNTLNLNTMYFCAQRGLIPLLHDIGEADIFLYCVSAVTDHELCGSVGGSGVCAGQGAVQGPQPCHPVRVHRRHCGAAARWLPSVLPLPRPLRQDGGASFTRESGTADGFMSHHSTVSHHWIQQINKKMWTCGEASCEPRSSVLQVDIEVNGEPVSLQMKLGENGEAFFVKETENTLVSNDPQSRYLNKHTNIEQNRANWHEGQQQLSVMAVWGPAELLLHLSWSSRLCCVGDWLSLP